MRIVKLTEDTKKNILEDLLKRSPNNYTQYEQTVADIINNVLVNGDDAVFSYTQQFDKWDCNADNIRVSAQEIAEAFLDGAVVVETYGEADKDFSAKAWIYEK